MKRLALVLTVAALAAVSCTTPGSVPVTTTSSSTTQAGASAREAVFAQDVASQYGIDTTYYPSGATVVAQFEPSHGSDCVGLVADYVEVPGSRVCRTDPSEQIAYSVAVELLPGQHNYVPALIDPATGEWRYGLGIIRVRW